MNPLFNNDTSAIEPDDDEMFGAGTGLFSTKDLENNTDKITTYNRCNFLIFIYNILKKKFELYNY